MLATNMVGIYTLWLNDIPERETIVGISQILLAGIFMYSFQMIFATIFLANAQTRHLIKGYIFAIIVMMASISLMGPLDVGGVAYVWLIMSTSLTLALMYVFWLSHKYLFLIWITIVGKNLLFFFIAVAFFVTLKQMLVVDGFYIQVILSGTIISLVFLYPVKKIFGKPS
jgi:O-antigen/teichoic acid export membrane protein